MLANALPGFRQFRFPSKLLTFTVLALTALAGQGWDALASGDRRTRRRVLAWSATFLVLTLTALALTGARRSELISWLESAKVTSEFGPFDARGAYEETRFGLVQAALVFGVALTIALKIGRYPRLAASLALIVLSADLVVANARYITTTPQTLMDTTPEVLALIDRAEKERPTPGPYRVHRTPIWSPISWIDIPSTDRARDFVTWERGTIQPKYAIPYGLQYTMTLGVAELYDYEWYFGGFYRTARSAAARFLSIKPESKIVVFPRRSFDMWNTRYFVLPYYARWADEHRGIASFLDRSERIVPPVDAFQGTGGDEKERAWVMNHDYQIRRNLDEYPRAWVVHDARSLRATRGMTREDRKLPMEEIMFSNDLFWEDSTRTVYDPRQFVWLEEDERPRLIRFLAGGRPGTGETVTVRHYQSDRVELEAVLDRPGVVVLADVFYPGWTLTIDGQPVPIFRANRMMRGAAVDAGNHTLIYRYDPASFRLGLIVSAAGLAALLLLSLWCTRAPLASSLAPETRFQPGLDSP